jgi:PAS domain S-box-containing protein
MSADASHERQRYREIFDTVGVSIWEEDASRLVEELDELRASGVDDLKGYLDEHPEFLPEAIRLIKVLDVNDATLDMYGAESKEQFLGSLDNIFVPETMPTVRDLLIAIADGRREFQAETVNRTLRGDPLHVLVRATLPSRRQDFARVIVVVVDISDRKLAEEELAKVQALLLAAVEQTPAGILIADAPDVTIRVANAAALGIRGETTEPLTDIPVELHPEHWQVFHPDGTRFAPEELPLSRAILEGKTSRNVEAVIRRKTGEDRWVLANAAPVRNARGEIVAGVVVFPDVTELKRAEEERRNLETQLLQAQKMESLGLLAGGIAHDFNNLLMGILGNAGLALSEAGIGPSVRTMIERIETAARRAADLTNQMLAYSGKGKFLVEPLSLASLVEEMAHLLETSITKKAVLRLDCDPDTPAIEADAAQVRQVIMNLITNASDALGEDEGVIAIRTGAMDADRGLLSRSYLGDRLDPGRYAFVEVADSGCGMDGSVREKIFDPFFTTKFTGRGLGLAAVLGIVRGHEGSVAVDSRPDRGTTVTVLFPPTDSPVRRIEAPAPVAYGWRGKGTILVVDDEESVRDVAAAILEQSGFTVITATDGLEALEAYRQRCGEIVVILLDMTMPRMDGGQALRELREIGADAPIVLSSGYSEEDMMGRVAGEDVAGFIQKPYMPSALIEKIRSVIR